jgi:hypothetical protein
MTAALLIFFAPACPAAIPDLQMDEVNHLIEYLRASDCRMIRNGKSYSGRDGARHVQRKYDYYKREISSTEQFVEYAASKSTMSGRLYQVQCPGAPAVSSADWLLEELAGYRNRQQD